jgi:hypothetical protein
MSNASLSIEDVESASWQFRKRPNFFVRDH